MFPNSGLPGTIRNTCLLLFHPAVWWKAKSAVRNVIMNFTCTSRSEMDFLNLPDQNFSLVIVLSLFLTFGQISCSLGVLIKFVLIKKHVSMFYIRLPKMIWSLKKHLVFCWGIAISIATQHRPNGTHSYVVFVSCLCLAKFTKYSYSIV